VSKPYLTITSAALLASSLLAAEAENNQTAKDEAKGTAKAVTNVEAKVATRVSNDNFSDSSINRILVLGSTLNQDATGLKTSTPLIDVPQSLSVVSRQQIDEQAFIDIGDILRYTPGASIGQGEGHRDQFTIRGQNTTADFFIDGLRDDVQYYRPLYNLESVEILRGSNALLFGRGGGGGVINRVTKAAELGENFGRMTASMDTFGSSIYTIDNNMTVSDDSSFRINAFYEDMANHRDFFEGDRFAINPTYTHQLSDVTKLILYYEHIEDDRVVDRGVPALADTPIRGYDDVFFGDPDFNFTTLEADIFRARIEHSINDDWYMNATLQSADYDKGYQNLYPISFGSIVTPAAVIPTTGLDGYRDLTDRRNQLAQVNVMGKVNWGGFKHSLLFGLEYGDQSTTNSRQDTLFADSNDDQITFVFSNPLVIPDYTLTAPVRDRDSDVSFTSLFVQDEMQISDEFILVAGLRYDDFDINVVDRIEVNNGAADGNNGLLASNDSEISPRLGVIYKPFKDVSVYASLTQSFLPRAGDQFLTLDLVSQALDPEEFVNREIGIKWDFDNMLSLTAALFDIERENGTAVNPNDPELSILTGTKTRGFEMQLTGNLTDILSINATYSYLDGDEFGRVDNGVINNRTLSQVPEHMFSLWSRYEVMPKFDVALGMTYQSEQFASISNTTELPAFTRVDAAAYYRFSDDLVIQMNIENLFDKDYFPAAHNDNNITTGEPTNARIGVIYNF
jgi:catecholate siderophore receptor